MTMQVAMIGKDGIVLASDACISRPPYSFTREQVGTAVRCATHHSKIRVYPDRKIAISCADDVTTAAYLADRFAESLDSASDAGGEVIESLIESVAKEHLDGVRRRVQCLIVISREVPLLLRFQHLPARVDAPEGDWQTFCEYSWSRAVAGDVTNPAVFWAEKYHESDLPMDRLVPLAAHLIQCASPLNTAAVGGLQIVKCSETGIEIVSPEECKEWSRKSKEWHSAIASIIFGT